MSPVRWSEVWDRHVAAVGAGEVEAGKARLLARVRAQRLAETRRRWLDPAGGRRRDGMSVGRVSQIEAGDISGIDVLDRYVAALGGPLEIVANFGDEQFKVG